MSDRYAVFGNPIAHSKSPLIHARFAAQTGQAMTYEALLAPLDRFETAIRDFIAQGGKGANITVPFKENAFRLADALTPRARRAGAVNTLCFDADSNSILGDNTDGAGLVTDIERNLGFAINGRRVLLLGAGGAARGALGPLLDVGAREIVIANRTAAKAQALAAAFAGIGAVRGGSFAALADGLASGGFDLVINATAASLGGERLPLPAGVFAPRSLAYDMMYSAQETPFLTGARQQGASRCQDGLGMLVEQAAEAFFVWRGVRPQTAPVMAALQAAA